MRKYITFFSIILFSFSLLQKLDAQVITKIGNFRICYNESIPMPVMVQNMIGVDSLKLQLDFNSQVISYIEYFAPNTALNGGTLAVNKIDNSIIITWKRTAPASIFNDTLIWLKFKGIAGSDSLRWQTSVSYYHAASGNLSKVFTNGSILVNPKINVLLTQIDPTCTKDCNANFMANALGGVGPYTYLWNGKPGRFDSIQTGMCSGANRIIITDTKGCKLDSIFKINGLPGANVKLIIEGNEDTTIYLQNPVLTFGFDEIYPTHVIEPPLWKFGDGDTAVSFKPTHTFSRANTNTDGYYDMQLIIKNENGCDTTIEVRIPVKDAKLKIPGVITPNGDSFNEQFMILNQNKTGSGDDIKITTEFQRMELVIFDRWGKKIYDDSNYQSDWQAIGVPDGAYYFKLTTVGYYRTDTYKGSITVLGGGANN